MNYDRKITSFMSLEILPDDLLLDHLLPYISLSALLALTCTSHHFACLCSDPILWKRKLQYDYNYYPSADTAQICGFKHIYRGIRKPEVYVWGHLGHGRRGSESDDPLPNDAYSYPVQIKMKSRIVSLASGGWFFKALDDMGAIYGWGTLHLSGRRQVSTEDLSFADPNCEARAPIKLQLPTRFVSICAGRNHSAALDVENRVWMIMQWGRPYLLTFTGSLDRSSRHPQIADKRIIQVACGHMPFVCFLTDDGEVYIIWATRGLFEHQATLKNEMLDRDGDGHPAKAINGAVLCTVIPISAEPVLLPSLPLDLPPLLSSSTDIDHEHQARTRPPKLIKITAGNNFVLGLTDQGHLLFINVNSEDTTNGLDNLRHWLNNGDRQWTYLPHFCDINHIIDDPVFTSRDNASNSSTIPIPSSIRITHISAYWKHFMAHTSGSPSIVLRAQLTAKANNVVEFSRTIQANFPNNEVMSVMTGCDHCVALSSDGIVRTWGKDERGTLGIGPQTEWKRELHTGDHRQGVVYEPTPVQFNHADPARRKFCFSITAAGWHAAALVFDMDEIMEDEEHHVGLVRTDHAMPLEGGSKQNTKGAIHRLKLQFNTAQRWKQMKRKMSLGTSEA